MNNFNVGDRVSFTLKEDPTDTLFYGTVIRLLGSASMIAPEKTVAPNSKFYNIKKVE